MLRAIWTALLLSTLTTATFAAEVTVPTTNGENSMAQEMGVLSAVDAFYASLNTLFAGDGDSMKEAWSHADDVSYMGPEGAYLIGWERVGPVWDAVAAAKIGGHVSPQDVHTVVSGNLALVTCVESGENVVNGASETVKIRSSTVFRNGDGKWKVVHHQTDLLKFLEK